MLKRQVLRRREKTGLSPFDEAGVESWGVQDFSGLDLFRTDDQ